MTTTLSLPPDLREELLALTETGLYPTAELVLADAVSTFFAARPDLRKAVGCRLYEKGHFSLGRAAEWSGLTVEAMKDELHEKGVVRRTENRPERIDAMARRALDAAGRHVG